MNNQETKPAPAEELRSLAEDSLNYLRYLADLGAPGLPEEIGGPGLSLALPASAPEAGPPRPDKTAQQSLGAAPECCRACVQWNAFNDLVQGPAELMLIVENSNNGSLLSGREGRLLIDIIEKGYKLTLDQVCLLPAAKCRRPGEPRLCRALWQAGREIAQPKVIMIMGRQAGEAALGSETASKSRQRGSWNNWHGIPAMPTHSPARLLGNPELKRETWSDIKKVLSYLSSLTPTVTKSTTKAAADIKEHQELEGKH